MGKMVRIFIKNMVCGRCIMVVENLMKDLDIEITHIELGEVRTVQKLSAVEKNTLEKELISLGFELISDKKSRIIEQIKNIIIKLVQQEKALKDENLSDLLSRKLLHEYSYLSGLFSEIEGVTIEKYFIAQKIEKVKELLVYDELSLSEIAYKLNYSSASHLSNQFMQVTGLRPSHFKKIRENRRKSLDEI